MKAVNKRDVDEERPELHALGQGARDDRGGRRHEHHLEEPVGHRGVAARHDGLGGGLVATEQRDLVSARRVRQRERTDPAPDIDVHQVVADQIVGEAGDGIEADVLQADDRGVLGADRTGLQHGEAGAHPHDQRAPDEEREAVEDELRLGGDRGVCLRHDKHQGHGEHEDQSNGPPAGPSGEAEGR